MRSYVRQYSKFEALFQLELLQSEWLLRKIRFALNQSYCWICGLMGNIYLVQATRENIAQSLTSSLTNT